MTKIFIIRFHSSPSTYFAWTSPASEAARAAPMIPASFRSCAGRTSARTSIWGMNRSNFLLAPAADDKEIGPDQLFHALQVAVEPLAPFSPAQVFTLPHGVGGVVFSDFSANQDVAEFGVRHQNAVAEKGRTEACAHRHHQHHPVPPRPAPKRISAMPAASASFST